MEAMRNSWTDERLDDLAVESARQVEDASSSRDSTARQCPMVDPQLGKLAALRFDSYDSGRRCADFSARDQATHRAALIATRL